VKLGEYVHTFVLYHLLIHYYFKFRCTIEDDSSDNVEIIVEVEDEIVSVINAGENVIGEGNELIANLISMEESNGIIGSVIVDLTILDEIGNSKQPQGNVEICFKQNRNGNEDDTCIAVFNEDNNRWECEDSCVERNDDGLLCGNVDHFSNFALLLNPSGTGGCGSSDWNGITNYEWLDYVIIGCVTLFVCFLVCIIILLGFVIPQIHGEEYMRIKRLRTQETRITVTSSA